MIHGFIDGYSRLITGLRASDNNEGRTVLDVFLAAARVYGVPSRLRGDHGAENVLVASWMEEHRGVRRGSYIWGRQVKSLRFDVYHLNLSVGVSIIFELNGFGST